MFYEAVVATGISKTLTASESFAKAVQASGGFSRITPSRDEINAAPLVGTPVMFEFKTEIGRVLESHCDEDGTWRVLFSTNEQPVVDQEKMRLMQQGMHLATDMCFSIFPDAIANTIRHEMKIHSLSVVRESTLSGAGWLKNTHRPAL